jgi:ferredoxin-nitrite reductase
VSVSPEGQQPSVRPEPDWDLVLKRNSVERLKREKFPLDIIDEWPEMAKRHYLDIPEEDMVRLQWYGLYHDKPRVGTFMLRIKIPSGILSPEQLRTIGSFSVRFGRDQAELATRQNVQLHWITLGAMPEIFNTLKSVGLNLAGGCGDTVRNITGCPVAGLSVDELFDTRPIVEEAAGFFYGNREYSDLPRKHKITIAACPQQCNAPEINCISLIGVVHEGRPGFAVRVGGGLSSTPRLSRDMGVFVEVGQTVEVLRALLDVWKSDLRYRVSRVKARFKFMVDDYGADGVREKVEAQLGRKLPNFDTPLADGQTEHIGVVPQKGGRFYVGFPVFMGRITGQQMLALADLAEREGGDVRLTRQQNFIITGIAEARLDEVMAEVGQLGFPLDVNRLRASGIGCTGQPQCNFAVAVTKDKLGEIILRLEERFGAAAEGLKLGVDGCPHSCCNHWVSDIGLQGTTARERGTGNEKLEAYEVYLRGGLGPDAAIGRPILRRVPSERAADVVERLVGAYLAERQDGEPFKSWSERQTDEQLVAIAGLEMAQAQ